MTDLWFRNPQSCLSVLAEEGISKITWTRQHLGRLKTDGIMPVRQFYMSTPVRPRIMLIGIQGSSEYTIWDRFDKPTAVYPTWSGKEDPIEDLYDFIRRPVGENEVMCSNREIPSSMRPVLGQPHRVVLHNCPSSVSGVGKQFWLRMSGIQQEFPNVELFVNGSKSFSTVFGLRFKAGDIGLSDLGDSNQHITLPNGMTIKLNEGELRKLFQWEDWIKALGFTIDQVVTSQMERYRFRVRAARWAAKHWADNYRFHTNSLNASPDYEATDETYVPPKARTVMLSRKFTTLDADKVLCNRCRIAPGCKLFRSDSICGLKDSKVGDLEKFFQSRNASLIIQGLANIASLQAQRLENAMAAETAAGETDPDVTKQMNSLFSNGVKLAKLVDPNLNGGPSVQVNVGVSGGNAQVVTNMNPKAVMADIMQALEHQGIARENVTADMVEGILKSMAHDGDRQRAIEANTVMREAKSSKKIIEAIDSVVVQDALPVPVSPVPTARDE